MCVCVFFFVTNRSNDEPRSAKRRQRVVGGGGAVDQPIDERTMEKMREKMRPLTGWTRGAGFPTGSASDSNFGHRTRFFFSFWLVRFGVVVFPAIVWRRRASHAPLPLSFWLGSNEAFIRSVIAILIDSIVVGFSSCKSMYGNPWKRRPTGICAYACVELKRLRRTQSVASNSSVCA